MGDAKASTLPPPDGEREAERSRIFPPPTSPQSELDRLRNVARDEPAIGGDLLKIYGTERALARIADSDLADSFVLKGGFLLRNLLPKDVRRPTLDADLHCKRPEGAAAVKRLASILSQSHRDDQVIFDPASVRSIPLENEGVRVTFKGSLGKGVIDGMLDLGVTAALVPEPEVRNLSPMLRHASPIKLQTYSTATVIAEKYETMLRRGLANTRLKDYYDVAMLARNAHLQGDDLVAALAATSQQRGTQVPEQRPRALSAEFWSQPENVRGWSRMGHRAPHVTQVSLEQACDDIWNLVAQPSGWITQQAREPGKRWDPQAQRWL